MKRTSLLLALIVAALALLSTSCGTSDYLQSLTLSSQGSTSGGFYNLAGLDGTLQLKVTANYHSGKTIDVTNASTWSVTPNGCAYSGDPVAWPTALCPGAVGAQPPNLLPAYGPTTVPISPTGLMTGVANLCTWYDLTDQSTGMPANPPEWVYTGWYQVTASYKGFTSQPVGIGVGVTTSNSPTGGCGPS